MDNKKLLPIGSVVHLGEGDNPDKPLVLIAGYGGSGESGNVCDYVGFAYPLGFTSRNYIAIFNQDIISDVVHMGLEDEEYNEDIEYIMETIKNARGGNE